MISDTTSTKKKDKTRRFVRSTGCFLGLYGIGQFSQSGHFTGGGAFGQNTFFGGFVDIGLGVLEIGDNGFLAVFSRSLSNCFGN